MERLSKTGLAVPDRVPWGTHLCQFYETKGDLLEVLVPYFKEGLLANEACVWITSDPLSVEEAIAALRAAVADLDQRLATGQMEIVPHETWYLRGGGFHVEALVTALEEKLAIALGQGYDGLRTTGDVSCVQDERWPSLIAYEEKIQAAIHAKKMISHCSYRQNLCTVAQVFQAVNAHDFAFVKRDGGWECIESKGTQRLLNRLLVKKHALDSSISPLVMTNLEGRVTYANPAAMKAWGYPSEREVLDRPVAEFVDDPGQLALYLNEVRTHGESVGELVAKRKDGTAFEAEIYGSLTRDDEGLPIGMMASCLDVTARKEAERQRAHRQRAEASLRDSEERLQTIVQNTSEIIYTLSSAGVFTYVSPAWPRLLGHDLPEVMGHRFAQFVHPDDIAACQVFLENVLTGEARWPSIEIRVRHKNGEWHWYRTSGSSGRDEQGQPICFIGVGENIDERKRNEQLLRQSHDELQAICTGIVEGLLITEIETTRIQRVNAAICQMLGYTERELLTMSIADLHPAEEVANDLDRFQATSEGRISINENRPVLRKDGTIFYADITGHRILYNGRPCLLALFRDITERKHAEERVRTSEERYRSLVENIRLGITLIDREHRIVMLNQAVGRFIDRPLPECVGQECFRVFRKQDAVCDQCPGLQAMRSGSPAEVDELRISSDGISSTVRIRAFPVLDAHGVPNGFIEVIEDITAQKRAAADLNRAKVAAEAANRTKSEFLANMSHELRTPMTAILGFSEILLDGPTKEEVTESAQTIQRNGQHLLSLINDILDLSKIEAGKQTADVRTCSPHPIVSEVVGMMQVRADAKGLALSVEFADDLPGQIRTDPLRLRQILVNLIGNAIKFTEMGRIRVVVQRDASCGEGGGLRFEVIDTGIGMSGEQLALLFQPLLAGGHLRPSQVRRHGSGPGHQQATGGDAGRGHHGVQRSRKGEHVPCDHRRGVAGRRASTTFRDRDRGSGFVIRKRGDSLELPDSPGRRRPRQPAVDCLPATQGGSRGCGGRGRSEGTRAGRGGRPDGWAVRPDFDGHADAGDGRLRSDPPTPCPGLPQTDHRLDGPRHEGGPPAVLGRGV